MSRVDSERFAISLVGLFLLRAGFDLQESVSLGRHGVVDLVASKYDDNGGENRFGVECKWAHSDSISRLEEYKQQVVKMTAGGLRIELAVVVNGGEKLWVTPGLLLHMVYDKSKIKVEIIPSMGAA